MLLRDQPAIVDLVHAVLGPLVLSRGGAEPLLAALELDRIRTLTGYNPADPAHRFTLQAAVLAAKVLNWPQEPLHLAE